MDRRLSDKRVFPAMIFSVPANRKDELLLPAGRTQRVWVVRKV